MSNILPELVDPLLERHFKVNELGASKTWDPDPATSEYLCHSIFLLRNIPNTFYYLQVFVWNKMYLNILTDDNEQILRIIDKASALLNLGEFEPIKELK